MADIYGNEMIIDVPDVCFLLCHQGQEEVQAFISILGVMWYKKTVCDHIEDPEVLRQKMIDFLDLMKQGVQEAQ